MSFFDEVMKQAQEKEERDLGGTPFYDSLGLPEPPPEPTFFEQAMGLGKQAVEAAPGIWDAVTETFAPVESVPQYEGVPELDAISGLPPRQPFSAADALTPTMDEVAGLIKQLEAGTLEFLGAESNIPSPTESVDKIHAEYKKRSAAGELDTLDEIMYSLRMGGPHLGIQWLSDKFDIARAKLLESITFEGEEPDTEISLREVLKEGGMELGEEARADLEKGIPEELPVGLSGLLAGKRSLMQFGMTGGLLGLAGKFSAGSISGAFGIETFLQTYDETLADTGDEERAFANGIFAGVVETATELPAFRALEKTGKGVLPAIRNYFAAELPGEYTAEILQFAGDYTARNPDATWKEVFNATLDAAPEIVATTTIAVGVGGTGTAAAYTGVTKAVQGYEKLKYASAEKRSDALTQELIAELQQSLNEAGTELISDTDNAVELAREIENISGKYQAFGGDELFGQLLYRNTLGPFSTTRREDAADLKKLLISQPDGTVRPYEHGTMPAGETVFGSTGGYTARIGRIENRIAAMQQILNAPSEQGFSPPEKNKVAQDLKKAEQELTNLRKRQHIFRWLREDGKQLIEALQKRYLPETSVILTDATQDQSLASNKDKRRLGQMWYTEDNELVLEIFPRTFVDKVALNNDGTLAELNTAKMIETLSHEFGHGLAHVWFNNLPLNVQEAVYKAYDGYRQRMVELRDDPTATKADLERLSRGIATRDTTGLAELTSAAEDIAADVRARSAGSESSLPPGAKGRKAGSFFNYVYSFDEWFAHEMERAVFGNSKVNKLAQNVLKKDAAILKTLHTQAKQEYAPNESFEKLLDFMQETATEQRLAEVRKILDPEIEIDTPEGDINKATSSVAKGVDKIGSDAGVDLPSVADPKSSLDKFNGFMRISLTLTQIARENQHIPSLQKYVEFVERWWAEKSKWNERAVETIGAWQSLGKDQSDRLAKFALAVTLESDNQGRALTLDELMEINQQKKHQLNEDAFAVWEQIDQDFKDALGYRPDGQPQGLYKALVEDIKRVHANNPEAAMEALLILEKEMVQMANRNFFPLSRFGRYTVTAKATEDFFQDGKFYKAGETITFETYEDINSQKKAARSLRAEFPVSKVNVLPDIMSDTQFAYAGMPPNLIRALKKQLGLTTEQLNELDEIILEQTSAARFKKHLLQRSGTPGFSHDAMRGYGSYMANFANAVARMEYAPAMQDQITEMEISVGTTKGQQGVEMGKVTDEANKRRKMANYLRDHFEYVMNPGNELANLRSIAFIFYMGFLPKSAFVNLSQVPMVAWPYLSARKELNGGLATGTAAAVQLTKAIKDVGNVFKKKGTKFTPEENGMFEELVSRGILDESLAQELGALAEGSNLQRMLPDKWGFGALKTRGASKVIRNTSYAGAYLFHQAEKFNRRVTALAAYRMARKQGMTHQEGLTEAHQAVRETQYEYARWNRPKMMQGKLSVIFMFKMYLENTLYHIARGEGGRRSLMMFMLMGGLSGLPFAEDAMDLYDLMVNMWNKHFGKKGARTALREDIREMATGLGLDPNMVMHGMAHKYGLGPVHLLEYAGIPIPNVNISGSLSLGRVIPGLEAMTTIDDPNLGRATADAAGAVVAIPLGILKAIDSDSPDDWKALEYAMPNAVRYWSQASRYLARGKETRMDGGTLYDFNLSDPTDISKIVGHAAGFTGTQLSEIKARDWAIKEAASFYRIRKQQLLNQLFMAQDTKDREGIKDAKDAIRDYNSTVPHSSLKITKVGKSLRMKKRNQRQAERALGRGRRAVPQAREMQELYPVHDENIK